MPNADKFKYMPVNTKGGVSHSIAAETGNISYPKQSVNFLCPKKKKMCVLSDVGGS